MPVRAESPTNGCASPALADPVRTTAGLLPDDEIVRRVLEGDRASFELVMRRYNQRLFRVARSILGDDDEAEDVLQETYVRAFEHLRQFQGRSKFSTWLTRIAVHEAAARWRKRQRMHTLQPGDAADLRVPTTRRTPDGETEAGTRELAAVLASAMDALPGELRTVFMLRVVEELDTEETAECLQLTRSNVKVRLHRARALLRSWIDVRMGEEAHRLHRFDGARCDRVVRSVLARLTGL